MTTVPAAIRRGPRGWLIAIGALGLVLLLTLAVLVGLVVTRPPEDPPYVPAAKSAASAAVRAFLRMSPTTVNADQERVLALSTGDFRREYLANAAKTRAAIVQNKVYSKGTVLRVALTAAGPTKVTALVAANSSVRNTTTPTAKVSHYRIRLILVNTHDRWLVSTLDLT
ncbi:hypothetical protein [Actinocatenispora rupis]|uniref:Mce-associated membrane protein n=1 Tax=Actinocatenispora rupis TaxID=519421 RepID=A0A8J3JA83_9ACTN|nr:hypothetical protein [Actinocatenispora rupis]GID14695.1 hypothetical protein Aru02nite_55840 [Actinocatenispora rupis]